MGKARFILFFLFAVLLLQSAVSCSSGFLAENASTPPRAIIIDQLSLTFPNQTFVETATDILNESGYSVDYYPGNVVTVSFYRNAMASGYSIMILRVHTGIASAYNELAFFTSEPYSQPMNPADPKYGDLLYDRIGVVTYHDPPEPGETSYFAIRYSFVEHYGKFHGTAVIVMGCYGMKYTSMAQAFTETGAKVYIGWDGLENADHSDDATVELLKNLVLNSQTVSEAVQNTMNTVKPDPIYGSQLAFYPATSESSKLEVQYFYCAFSFSPETDIGVNQAVTFNASSSYSLNATIVLYAWSFGDGNVTSTDQPSVVHTYTSPDTFNVTLTGTDSKGLTVSTSQTLSVKIPTVLSISTNCPTSVIGFAVSIAGNLYDISGKGLKDQTVTLSYVPSGVYTLTPITSDMTDDSGHYEAMWIPSATGFFTIIAEWAGNSTHFPAHNSTTLSSIAFENQYVFTVESNSTISNLAFDSASQQLSFNATEPPNVGGYVKVRIAKDLITDTARVRVFLDSKQREFSMVSTDDSWLLTFDIPHSIDNITIGLEAASLSFIDTLPGKVAIAGLVVGATVILATVYVMRRKRAAKPQKALERPPPPPPPDNALAKS